MKTKAKWVNLEEVGKASTERRCLLCTWHRVQSHC